MSDLQLDTRIPERVIISVAHADDIEFGMSGTVARWTAAGAQVSYVIITNNSSGSNEPGADLNALSQTRETEQIASAAAVGVTDVRFLGYQDGILEPTLALRRDLTRIIREIKPDVVVTMDPTVVIVQNGYINHPDHVAAGMATLYAVFPSAETRPIFPELLAEGYEPHNVPYVYFTLSDTPTHISDISAHVEQKRAALACHKSQLDDKTVEMVMGWNAEDGQKIGVTHAETYRVINRNWEDGDPQKAEEATANEAGD